MEDEQIRRIFLASKNKIKFTGTTLKKHLKKIGIAWRKTNKRKSSFFWKV